MRVKHQKPLLLIFFLFFFCRQSESWRLWSFIKGKQGRWKSTDMPVRAQAKRLSHDFSYSTFAVGLCSKKAFFFVVLSMLS